MIEFEYQNLDSTGRFKTKEDYLEASSKYWDLMTKSKEETTYPPLAYLYGIPGPPFRPINEASEERAKDCDLFKSEPKLPESDPDLKPLLKEWQERLGLQDWIITVHWTKAIDQDSQGRAKVAAKLRQGVIQLLHPNQTSDYAAVVRWPEVVLVHELLHFRFHIIPEMKEESSEYDEMEAAIELTAQALVAAKYGLVKLPVIPLTLSNEPSQKP